MFVMLEHAFRLQLLQLSGQCRSFGDIKQSLEYAHGTVIQF